MLGSNPLAYFWLVLVGRNVSVEGLHGYCRCYWLRLVLTCINLLEILKMVEYYLLVIRCFHQFLGPLKNNITILFVFLIIQILRIKADTTSFLLEVKQRKWKHIHVLFIIYIWWIIIIVVPLLCIWLNMFNVFRKRVQRYEWRIIPRLEQRLTKAKAILINF